MLYYVTIHIYSYQILKKYDKVGPKCILKTIETFYLSPAKSKVTTYKYVVFFWTVILTDTVPSCVRTKTLLRNCCKFYIRLQ